MYDGELELYTYRMTSKGYRDKTWYLALSRPEIEAEEKRMNEEETDGTTWVAEVIPVILSEGNKKKLAAKIVGSNTSGAKTLASRENGKKGGRPKANKPIS